MEHGFFALAFNTGVRRIARDPWQEIVAPPSPTVAVITARAPVAPAMSPTHTLLLIALRSFIIIPMSLIESFRFESIGSVKWVACGSNVSKLHSRSVSPKFQTRFSMFYDFYWKFNSIPNWYICSAVFILGIEKNGQHVINTIYILLVLDQKHVELFTWHTYFTLFIWLC